MKTLRDYRDVESVEIGDHGCSDLIAPRTARLIDKHLEVGYPIVVGNDWQKSQRPKYAGREMRLIARTNSRRHGKCLRTIWAIK